MFTKIKRKTIGNLFGIQCKKKLWSERSARSAANDLWDETNMDPFIHTVILVKQVLFNLKSPPKYDNKEELLLLLKYDNEYLRLIANSPPLFRLAHWAKRAHS